MRRNLASWSAWAVFSASGLWLHTGCGDPPPEPAPAPPSASAPDAVDPNALVEGASKLFNVPLPTRSTLIHDTAGMGRAHVPFPLAKVSNYFRARLEAPKIDVGPRQTVFHDATIKGGDPNDKYYVVIKRTSATSEVTFRRLAVATVAADDGYQADPPDEEEKPEKGAASAAPSASGPRTPVNDAVAPAASPR